MYILFNLLHRIPYGLSYGVKRYRTVIQNQDIAVNRDGFIKNCISESEQNESSQQNKTK